MTPQRSRLFIVVALAALVIIGSIAASESQLESSLSAPSSQMGGADSIDNDLERYPPIVQNIWITKLTDSAVSDNVLMEIEYDTISNIPDELPIYVGQDSVIFEDNGVAPDSIADDRIYSAHITEDINTFLDEVEGWESNIANDSFLIQWRGHTGRMITNLLPEFDSEGFENFERVNIDPQLLMGTDCENLIKQNSLFITELDVIEDPARTYNVATDAGNPTGAWTFGQLMKNMANESATGISAKDFIKEWLLHWISDQTVNGQTIIERRHIYTYVIDDWLEVIVGSSVGQEGWEQVWDNQTEADILKYAPFRLMHCKQS